MDFVNDVMNTNNIVLITKNGCKECNNCGIEGQGAVLCMGMVMR